MKCELLINPDDDALRAMKGIQQYFLDQQKPMNFNPFDQNSVLMEKERQFEEVCNVMEDNGSMNVKTLTEFEFYNKMRFYDKKFRSMQPPGESFQ